MARLNESPGPGPQSANKHQITLKNGAFGNFLSSPAKPSGSQSPLPNKRIKSLTATGSPRSDASRSHSPPAQRLSSQIPLTSPTRKTLSDTAADDMDTADRSTPADVVTPAVVAESTPAESTPAESIPTPTAVAADIEVSPAAEVNAATPEPVIPRPGMVSSVRKTLSSVVNNFTGVRNGTATVTSTFEQTIVSRKRSREPEAEATPAPVEKEAEEEAEAANVTADINDTTIQLGNQIEEDVAAERAKSPVKEDVEAAPEVPAVPAIPAAPAPPAAEESEINVTTTANNTDKTDNSDNADTIEAAETTKPAAATSAAAAAAEDKDVDMENDAKNGLFVFDGIITHRRDPKDKTLFQLQVRWKHDEPTWEPESNIHEDAEEALFAYWDSVRGGRLGAMADKELWHALRVEKHKQKPNGKVELYVCWTGSRERSWEPEENMLQVARPLVEDYWASRGGREKLVKAVAAPVKKPRGRPRKASEPDEALKEPAQKKARQGRKRLLDDAVVGDDQAEKSVEEQAQVDGEGVKKRGRGRPRRSPVS
ncbi:chromo domain-containing protein [Colletotrichum truncatum]|uniref:Chromo domain-containing protein n=1 Tax=Colletotrichum truncatum TaxID=5467 RepID=A0ACC3YJX4_COLTU